MNLSAKIRLILPAALIVLVLNPGLGQEPTTVLSNPQIISVSATPGSALRMRRLGLDLLAEWEGRIYIVASAQDLATLRGAGIPFASETGRWPAQRMALSEAQGGLNGAYHSYLELERELPALAETYPDLAKVYDLGVSLEGRHIRALKISAHPAIEEAKPEVLFLGCHHAREWISVEVPFLLGKYLVEHYALDPDIRNLVDACAIWIVPLINPDGLEYSIQTYRYWRKNRRDNRDGSFGIDLNRNYSYQWGVDDEGSSPIPDSETYRGPTAFSEPETRALRDFVTKRNIGAMISYHSYAQTIVYPWGYTSQPADGDGTMAAIAARMAALIQEVNGRTYSYGESSRDMYLTNGDLTDWAYAVSGIPAYTIELPPLDEIHGGFFNAEADIASIFAENLPAMLYLIDWSIRNYSAPTAEKTIRPGDRPHFRPRRRSENLKTAVPDSAIR
jgi:carboxypeptidase T